MMKSKKILILFLFLCALHSYSQNPTMYRIVEPALQYEVGKGDAQVFAPTTINAAFALRAQRLAQIGSCVSGNCRNGQGTFIYTDGDKYEGEWNGGKRNGQGVYISTSGGRYTFRNPNGQGIYKLTNGYMYEGNYLGGKMNGRGKLTFANDEKYVGNFKDDKLVGQGTYSFPNGEKYEGEFKNDLYNGQGTYTYTNGDIWQGKWENGEKIINQGTMISKNESSELVTNQVSLNSNIDKSISEEKPNPFLADDYWAINSIKQKIKILLPLQWL